MNLVVGVFRFSSRARKLGRRQYVNTCTYKNIYFLPYIYSIMQCGDVYILTTEFVCILFDVDREKLNYNYKISIIHMYVRCTKMYIFNS